MTNAILYVVATPIGHLDDMTLRAIETLKTVEYIACEDTRETKKLLDHFGIQTRCVSYHAQSLDAVEDRILADLQAGKQIALVSDRGTPGISDPGQRLIARTVEAGIRAVPIPGASALISALQASGASTQSFLFLGYLPHKKGRQTFLTNALATAHTVVFYESPHRILKCLAQLVELGAGDRRVIIARELTKMYEEFLRGTAQELLSELESRPAIQGEFVVILDEKH